MQFWLLTSSPLLPPVPGDGVTKAGLKDWGQAVLDKGGRKEMTGTELREITFTVYKGGGGGGGGEGEGGGTLPGGQHELNPAV